MAYTPNHSASWSEGITGTNSIETSGGHHTDTISWADIQPNQGFGLAQSGVSPFRDAGILDSFQKSQPTSPEIGIGAQAEPRRINSSLLKVISRLQRGDAGAAAPADRPLSAELPPAADSPEAKLSIGLAIAPGADVHDKGKVARAVVRLVDLQAPEGAQETAQAAPEIQTRLEQEETRPIVDPYRHVADQTNEIKAKFDESNVKYGRTTLMPNGDTVLVQTAADNSTLTTTKSENGNTSQVVHDRYRRPITQQDTNADGTWSFSQLAYDDSRGIKPFCSEKLTVNHDGSMVRAKYTTMGQLESKQLFA